MSECGEGAMNNFRQMHIPQKLGEEFIQTFTRIEYALKASGDFADSDANGIQAACDRFSNSIDVAFRDITDNEFRIAVDFLLTEPARKQIITGFGPLILDPRQTKAQRTLLVVRTVRNNNTHGGKIQPEGENEVGRNEKLVACSLTVLKQVTDLNDNVKKKFHG
jgi:hypothetical protein